MFGFTDAEPIDIRHCIDCGANSLARVEDSQPHKCKRKNPSSTSAGTLLPDSRVIVVSRFGFDRYGNKLREQFGYRLVVEQEP